MAEEGQDTLRGRRLCVETIGALETSRYSTSEALEDYPRNDYNIVCGIMDETFRTRGWDAWERKLRDVLRSHIEPAPTNTVEIRPANGGEAQVAVVSIDSVEPNYYLCPANGPKSYLIREGTSARRIEGAELERRRNRM